MLKKALILNLSLITLACYAAQESFDEKFINDLYVGISGYGIDDEEIESIKAVGGAPTYGEGTFETFGKIANDLKKELKNGVFCDFGCGVGKAVVQFFLTTDAKKCIGVELSKTRVGSALDVKKKLDKKGLIKKGRALEFKQGNITEADVSDADVVFMCSTCFSKELMSTLTNKLAQLKKGLVVVTLKQLPEHKSFKLEKTLHLSTSWSKESPFYFYRRV